MSVEVGLMIKLYAAMTEQQWNLRTIGPSDYRQRTSGSCYQKPDPAMSFLALPQLQDFSTSNRLRPLSAFPAVAVRFRSVWRWRSCWRPSTNHRSWGERRASRPRDECSIRVYQSRDATPRLPTDSSVTITTVSIATQIQLEKSVCMHRARPTPARPCDPLATTMR